ncbi:hypothetical protein KGQ71_02685 [Patescibacteria group bacterium]|nr:hypothetical protein [Patescibacteria group bacterium]
MHKIKNDKYKSARGGHSRLLEITCEHCRGHISYYQKDGPGILKRMYLDRILDSKDSAKELRCKGCGRTLGVLIIYEKEQRPAYRLFVGSVSKKLVRRDSIS